MSEPAKSQPAAAEPAKKEFIKRNAGLTIVPAKVMVISDLEVLDLSENKIQVMPKRVFPDIDKLKTLNLSHNRIHSLPDDISALKNLELLILHLNSLTALPEALSSLTTVKTLDASFNKITYLSNGIGKMEGLQALHLAGNRLRSIPSDIGWLGLKQLNISENPELHIPPHVLQSGFKAVISYLQVVGEQHHLVSSHMAAFRAKLTELQEKHRLDLGDLQDETGFLIRLKVAHRLGILALHHCHLTSVPEGLVGHEALQGVQVVDLSQNRLKALPTELLTDMDRLLVLSLSDNNIKQLPQHLGLSPVRVLDLSFNKLTSLPPDIGQQLPSLQQLYLANNFLSDLPDSLALAPLQDLFLSENEFQTVPRALSCCAHLAKLSLAACQLRVLGDELAALHGLRFLDVSFNKLTSLPASLSSMSALAAFNLSFNPFGGFPGVLSSLTSLRELNLDNTGITNFPIGLGELRLLEGLQVEGCPLVSPLSTLYAKDPLLLVAVHNTQLLPLDLSGSGLEEVPMQLMQLTQLTSINLGKNAIKDLPPGLGELRKLQQLCLRGNPLRQPFMRLLDTKGDLAVLAFLRPEGSDGLLDMEGCGFEALPKEVWELPGRTALVALQLTNNRLKDLPQGMSALVGLTRLVVDNNLLRQLPPVVLTLPSLAILMASGNSITHLPDTLGSAHQLQALILHSNQITQLPDSITCLTNLKALAVTSNRLWQLPAGTWACTALKLIDCSHNMLARLPAGLGKLGKLRNFKLTHNKLSCVPVEELQQLQSLAELHLSNNAFTVEIGMNATGQTAVRNLLAAIAASPAGQLPVPQLALSRNASSLYSTIAAGNGNGSTIGSRRASQSMSTVPNTPLASLKTGMSKIWTRRASIDTGGSAAAGSTAAIIVPCSSESNNSDGGLRSSVAPAKRSAAVNGSAVPKVQELQQEQSEHDQIVQLSEQAPVAPVQPSKDPAAAGAATEATDVSARAGSSKSAADAPGQVGQAARAKPAVAVAISPGPQQHLATAAVPARGFETTADADGIAAVLAAQQAGSKGQAGGMQAAATAAAAVAAAQAPNATTAVGPTAIAAAAQPREDSKDPQAAGMQLCSADSNTVTDNEWMVDAWKRALTAVRVSSEAGNIAAQQQQAPLQDAAWQEAAEAASSGRMLRATSGSSSPLVSAWDAVPLMDIPRIIKALAAAPPPPAACKGFRGSSSNKSAAAAGQLGAEANVVQGASVQNSGEAAEGHQPLCRPQTKARFRRVIQQTTMAMALLEKSMVVADSAGVADDSAGA